MELYELHSRMTKISNDYRTATEKLERAIEKHKYHVKCNVIAEKIRKEGMEKIYGAKPSAMIIDEYVD